jgi:hypothetical protein
MTSLYVLDVTEFRPLVEAASRRSDLTVIGPVGGYYRVRADGQLRIERAETGLPEALWFGAFTAGYDGEELVIDQHQFWIGPKPAAGSDAGAARPAA